MKTTILTIATVFTVALGLTKTTYAAPVNKSAVTVLTDITAINKIEVRGNVELFISDGPADQVKVYNKYYSESALVQSKNGVLRIASYASEKLVVWVTAKDLSSLSAYDNAQVKSFGDISKIEFAVDLHNNASANLNLNAFNANVTVNDRAKAELKGSAEEFYLNHNIGSTVNNYNFKAAHYTENRTGITIVNKEDDLADL
ncbi:MAG TPA: DUF2807 domain-containing protein [Mucilaginibacter sp.]|jgi:hypothetical protein